MSDYSDLIERLRSQSWVMIAGESADALEQLYKFKILVEFIAYDYHELSHDKAYWQRDDWKKRCKKLIEEYYENPDSV